MGPALWTIRLLVLQYIRRLLNLGPLHGISLTSSSEVGRRLPRLTSIVSTSTRVPPFRLGTLMLIADPNPPNLPNPIGPLLPCLCMNPLRGESDPIENFSSSHVAGSAQFDSGNWPQTAGRPPMSGSAAVTTNDHPSPADMDFILMQYHLTCQVPVIRMRAASWPKSTATLRYPRRGCEPLQRRLKSNQTVLRYSRTGCEPLQLPRT